MANTENTEHTVGTIHSIALADFLTYNQLYYRPGKHLNVIIGPNGSGKSTVAAGIILGCGGKPSVLSRSKDISDYVKNGKEKANIEIELVKNTQGELITLNRAFTKAGKETFKIDGKKVTSKAYIEKVQSFNIQVDNLCMFLPQDRVQDFTKLNAQEILHNTQISVCSTKINESFDQLKSKRDRQKNSVKQNEVLQTQLNDNINRNEQLHGLIEKSRLRERLASEIDIAKKKRAWIEHDKLKVKYDEADKDVKKLKESIEKKNRKLRPLEKRQNEIAGTKTALKNAISNADTKIGQTTNEIDRIVDASLNMQSEIKKARQVLRNTITTAIGNMEELRERKLLVTIQKKEYEEAQTALIADCGDCDQKSQGLDLRLRAQRSKIEDVAYEIQKINTLLDEQLIPSINYSKRKIEIIKDTHTQRFNVLRSHFDDTYRAYQWLEENRTIFHGTIYNPVMTEITVKNQQYAKYLENTVAVRDLEMFLCTDKADMQKLIHTLRNEMRLHVNIGYSAPTDEVRYQPAIPINRLNQNFGLYTYLIDVIDGPAPVINYLCSLYNLQNVPLGDDRTSQHASKLPNHIQIFFSQTHRFAANVSKYSNKKSVVSTEVIPKNLLNIGVDHTQITIENETITRLSQQAEKNKMKRSEFEQKVESLEAVANEIRDEKRLLISKVAAVKTKHEKYRRSDEELRKMKSAKINIAAERLKKKNQVDKIVDSIAANNANAIKVFEMYKNHVTERLLAKKKLHVFDTSTGNVEELIYDLKREIARIQDTCKRASSVYDDLKRRLKTREKEALELTEGIAPTDRRFKYGKQFEKLPNTREELQDKIDEMQGRVECIRGIDPQILVEYEERKEAIEELKQQLATEGELAVNLENEIQRLHEVWYPEIIRIVSSINKNFSNFFAKMGFVGEVELVRKEEHDYTDYGIQIRVQYRDNEKLEALNRHVQSGGERAVAIAVFTLSLQHLTMVPFRCVDEINQGMDPKNERKIFQMLVDITCRPGQSQYFFVTPKLLPDLPYHDLMSIAVVHNGKHVSDPFVFTPNEDNDDAMEVEDDDEEDDNDDSD